MARKKNKIRDDGRYAVQVYLGLDENGKRRYKTVYGRTQAEAELKAQDMKVAMRKGLDINADRDTFGDWAKRWLKIKTPEVSHGQIAAYIPRIDYINNFIHDAHITKLKAVDLQDIINSLAENNPNTGQPASKQVLKLTKSTISQIFSLAIENRVLDYNPAIAIKLPKNATVHKRRALTEEEQQWIRTTDHRAKRAAMIMMYAGLRRGELIPLTWNDINLKDKTINVYKSVERISNPFILKDGVKTDAGVRTVDIPDILVEFLKTENRGEILVCEKVSGGMHTDSSWKRMWDSYLTELNITHGNFSPFHKQPKSKFSHNKPFVIENITPHMLRHTFATLLYFAGVDILTAKEQLGHSDIKMTMQIYTHLDKIHKRKSMSRLDDYLNEQKVI